MRTNLWCAHDEVPMRRYADLSGTSGVVAYEIGPDFIDVRFRGGDTYRYTHASAGAVHIEQMKKLAIAGRGLGTYISRHVREAYASKR
jgi:hypothetical protein